MPFSFQPTISTGAAGGTQVAQPTSLASSLTSSTQNLMERAKSGGNSIVEIVLFAVFGLTALVSVGLFGYKYYLSSRIEAKKQVLDGYEQQLAGIPLGDMKKVSSRMKIIGQLLKSHPSAQVAFMIIEASVENSIYFTKFDLRQDETTHAYKLILSGVAPDYKSLAQQLDALTMKPYSNYMPKVTLDTLAPDTNGKVTFSFTTPITITGYIPETFSVMDGTLKPAPAPIPAPVPNASSTEIMGAGTSTPSATGTPPGNLQ